MPGTGRAPIFTRSLRNATIVSTSVPSRITAGQTVQITITIKNTGTEAWSLAGKHKLVDPRGAASPFRPIAVELGSAIISINQSFSFTFSVTPPSIPGRYRIRYRMAKVTSTLFFGTEFGKDIDVVSASTGTIMSPTQPAVSQFSLIGSGITTPFTPIIAGATNQFQLQGLAAGAFTPTPTIGSSQFQLQGIQPIAVSPSAPAGSAQFLLQQGAVGRATVGNSQFQLQGGKQVPVAVQSTPQESQLVVPKYVLTTPMKAAIAVVVGGVAAAALLSRRGVARSN